MKKKKERKKGFQNTGKRREGNGQFFFFNLTIRPVQKKSDQPGPILIDHVGQLGRTNKIIAQHNPNFKLIVLKLPTQITNIYHRFILTT